MFNLKNFKVINSRDKDKNRIDFHNFQIFYKNTHLVSWTWMWNVKTTRLSSFYRETGRQVTGGFLACLRLYNLEAYLSTGAKHFLCGLDRHSNTEPMESKSIFYFMR